MKSLLMSGFLAAGLLMGQPTIPEKLSVGEVERMLNAHVPQNVIEGKVQHAGQTFHLTTNQIIALKQAGASDGLLQSMAGPAQSGKATTAPESNVGDYVLQILAMGAIAFTIGGLFGWIERQRRLGS